MPEKNIISHIIQTALAEDRAYNDITTKTLVDKKQISQAYIISREDAVICGNAVIKEIFKKFDAKATVVSYHKDGDRIKKNEPVIFIKGPTATILSCERVSLNFLARLSGIATLTAEFVKQAGKAKILDTRKTTPGLRELEKYAVVCGGGFNHRRDLSDMMLIKDNHLAAQAKDMTIADIIRKVRQEAKKKIELEVDTLKQFTEALQARPDIILLDNMTTAQLKTAVRLKKHAKSKVLLEASGGIDLRNIAKVAQTGVDRISIGQLTHSVKAVDFSLEFVI
ncbi:MAG: carboxylating nicotinate-nucleotide diphosphorylase [Candidatus Omnitrophica bacterium]|nr:carboxylating nicotinate-nucleotide diphosphorylase [Candidatus Omnitrophota bacterium]